jgi:hypothetical protein
VTAVRQEMQGDALRRLSAMVEETRLQNIASRSGISVPTTTPAAGSAAGVNVQPTIQSNIAASSAPGHSATAQAAHDQEWPPLPPLAAIPASQTSTRRNLSTVGRRASHPPPGPSSRQTRGSTQSSRDEIDRIAAEDEAEREREQREWDQREGQADLIDLLLAQVAAKDAEIAERERILAERNDTIADFSSRMNRPLDPGSAILPEQTRAANPEQLVCILQREFWGGLGII